MAGPETGVPGSRSRFVEAGEPFEYRCALPFGDPGSVVCDDERAVPVALGQLDGDGGCGVAAGVVQQVADDPAEFIGAAGDLRGRDAARVDDHGGAACRGADLVEHDVVEVDHFEVAFGRPGVAAGKQQQIIDHPSELRDLVELASAGRGRIGALRVLLIHFEFGAHARQRCAQSV
jgi:hypothetical protein